MALENQKLINEKYEKTKTNSHDFQNQEDYLQISYTLKRKNISIFHMEKVTEKLCQQIHINFDQIAQKIQQIGIEKVQQKNQENNKMGDQRKNEGHKQQICYKKQNYLLELLMKIQFLQKRIQFLQAEQQKLSQEVMSNHFTDKNREKSIVCKKQNMSTNGSNSARTEDKEWDYLSLIQMIDPKIKLQQITFLSTPINIQKQWYYYNQVKDNTITCQRTKYFKQGQKPPQIAYYQLISQNPIATKSAYAFGFKILKSYNGSIIIGITHISQKEKRKSHNSGLGIGYEGARARVYGKFKKEQFKMMGNGFGQNDIIIVVVSPYGKKYRIQWFVNNHKQAEIQQYLLDQNYHPFIQTSFEGDQVQFFQRIR